MKAAERRSSLAAGAPCHFVPVTQRVDLRQKKDDMPPPTSPGRGGGGEHIHTDTTHACARLPLPQNHRSCTFFFVNVFPLCF